MVAIRYKNPESGTLKMSFFEELKRRNVFRMAVLYLVGSWLLMQVADVLFEQLGVPSWAFRLLLGMMALGFPIALFFSWLFEMTPEGLKLERDVNRGQSITHHTGSKMNRTIVVLLVLVIAGLIVDRLIPETPAPPASDAVSVSVAADAKVGAADDSGANNDAGASSGTAPDRHSIAVLPFVNMSGDPENEYFSDGLSEELLNALVRMGGLQVTGRTSSFAFKGHNQDLREIGRLLSVANVLEGSVRKAGNQVRITAQLIKTSDGFHLWSETFDRELDDIFAIQEEIAGQVIQALQVALLGPEQIGDGHKTRVTVSSSQNADAYEAYLRGIFVLRNNLDNEEGLNTAKNHFEKALETSPDYLEANWGMFSTWDRIHRNGFIPFGDSIERMGFYAAELERIAPGSEQALVASARMHTIQFDNIRASELLEEAVRRFPGSAPTLAKYGAQSGVTGGYDKGLEALREARRLDPLSLENIIIMANVYYRAGECTSVEELLKQALALDPVVGRVRYSLAMCLFETEGDAARAMSIVRDEPVGFMLGTATAILQQKLGNPEAAQKALDDMLEAYGESAAYQYTQIYTQWGDSENALKWLETAAKIRDPGLVIIGLDRLVAPLRKEPGFQQIQKKTGFL